MGVAVVDGHPAHGASIVHAAYTAPSAGCNYYVHV